MRLTTFAAVSVLCAGMTVTALAQPPVGSPTAGTTPLVQVAVKGAGGKDMGSATLTDGPRGVLVRLELKGLTPGWHGLHFHEKADCSKDDFTTAGAHVHDASPTPAVHGLLNAEATDKGDLPNVYAGADGTATAEVYSIMVALKAPSGRLVLQDADGSALVVHANPDDHKAQPIGGAGPRVACAVIK